MRAVETLLMVLAVGYGMFRLVLWAPAGGRHHLGLGTPIHRGGYANGVVDLPRCQRQQW